MTGETERNTQERNLPIPRRLLFSLAYTLVALWICCTPPATAQTAWPRIADVSPGGAQRGRTVDLTITGVNIGLGTAVLFEGEGLTVEAVTPEKPPPPPAPKEGEKPPEPPKNPPGKLVARVRIAPDAAPGIRALRVVTPVGVSEWGQFVVGQWPEVGETEPNNARDQAQRVTFPTTVIGRVDPREDVDCFRFAAQAGQTLVFDLLASRLGESLDSILSLQDAGGREVALNEDSRGKDSLLAFTAPADGDYTLVLRDLGNRGGGDYRYRLSMGTIPYVTGIFPLGGRPGGTVPMELTGFNLGPTSNDQRPTTNDQRPTVFVVLPEAADPALVPIAVPLPTGTVEPRIVALDAMPEVTEAEPNNDPGRAQLVPVPSVVNARIFVPGSATADGTQSRLSIGRGDRSPPAPAATQASQEKALRASATPENVANEVGTRSSRTSAASLRPISSPAVKETDADCYRFRAEKGQKIVLEVIARRCGSQLDSLLAVTDLAGKELVSNDDAGGKDSRLEFDVSAAGEYIARVTDLQEGGGPDYSYRLQISIAAPDFRLSFTPDRLDIPRGDRASVKVTAERRYGFDGEIALEVGGLPPGVSLVGPARIPAGQKEATLVLSATADAPLQAGVPRVSGLATIEGKPVRHAAQGLEEIRQGDEKRTRPGKLVTAAVTEPGDLTLGASPESVTLAPGGTAEITLTLTRREKLKGNRPLIVVGLPPGVTADAPEIAEDKAEAKVTLKAESGAQPTETSIVIMTQVDLGDNRRRFHCAAPITLKVEAKQGGSGG
jgi:hypothetical protein